VLIHNEQTKLLASALDRASTVVGVGSVFPLFNLFKPATGLWDAASAGYFIAAVHVPLLWAIVLHICARLVLRWLR
jgi:hypothetical protein